MTRMISRGSTNDILCRMKANRINRTSMTCIRPEREDCHVISWIKTPDTRCIICWCSCKYISVVSIWTPTNIPNNISKRKIYLKNKLMDCFLLKRWRNFVVTNQKAICLEWGFNPRNYCGNQLSCINPPLIFGLFNRSIRYNADITTVVHYSRILFYYMLYILRNVLQRKFSSFNERSRLVISSCKASFNLISSLKDSLCNWSIEKMKRIVIV